MTSRQCARYDAMRDDMLQGGNEYQNVAQPSVRTSVAVWKVPRQRLAPAKARSSVVKSGDSGSIEPSLNSVFSDFPTAQLVASVKHFDWASFAEIINADHSLVNEDAALLTISAKAKLLWDATRYREAEDYFRTAALLRALRGLSHHQATYYLLSLVKEDDEYVLEDLERACSRGRNFAEDKDVGDNDVDYHEQPGNPQSRPMKHQDTLQQSPRTSENASPQPLISTALTELRNRDASWFAKGKLFRTWKVVDFDEDATSRILHRRSTMTCDSGLSASSPSKTVRKFAIYLLVVCEGPELCVTVRAKFCYSEIQTKHNSRFAGKHAIIFNGGLGPATTGDAASSRSITIKSTIQNVPQASMWIDFRRAIPVRTPAEAEEIGCVDQVSWVDFRNCCARVYQP